LAEIGAEACLELSRAHLLGIFSPHCGYCDRMATPCRGWGLWLPSRSKLMDGDRQSVIEMVRRQYKGV
jgi:hypothetical protein